MNLARPGTLMLVLGFPIFVLVVVLSVGGQPGQASPLPSSELTPRLGAMTIYSVTNLSTVNANVQHVFQDSTGVTTYEFTDQLPPAALRLYHVRDMPQIPSPFEGKLRLISDQPITALIVDYDYPSAATPASPTATSTATLPPTFVGSVTPAYQYLPVVFSAAATGW
jgi:hypothetical protein